MPFGLLGKAIKHGIGAIGNTLAGDRADNEFRKVDPNDFQTPGLGAAIDQRNALAGGFAGRGAPQAGQSAFRAGQHNLINMLQQRASGAAPSIANQTMQAGLDRGMAQQQAMAATGRGNPALAARQASQASSGMAQQMAGQGAINRLAEMEGAQNMLGGVLQGARGQDQARSFANMQAQLQQTGLNDQAQLSALQQALQGLGLRQGDVHAAQDARTKRFLGMLNDPTDQEAGLGALSSIFSSLPF